MTEYYVSGVMERYGCCETCSDDKAKFWTLYERDAQGLSQAVADFYDRESAEKVMVDYQARDGVQQKLAQEQAQVKVLESLVEEYRGVKGNLEAERDALQQQVNALAAENLALKENLIFWDDEDPQTPYHCPEDIANSVGMELNAEFEVQVAAMFPNQTYRVSAVGEYDCTIELVSGAMPETPATEAIKRKWMAEGVDSFSAWLRKSENIFDENGRNEWEDKNRVAVDKAKEFTAQLRQPEEK